MWGLRSYEENLDRVSPEMGLPAAAHPDGTCPGAAPCPETTSILLVPELL